MWQLYRKLTDPNCMLAMKMLQVGYIVPARLVANMLSK
jgi:hypothetical protein